MHPAFLAPWPGYEYALLRPAAVWGGLICLIVSARVAGPQTARVAGPQPVWHAGFCTDHIGSWKETAEKRSKCI